MPVSRDVTELLYAWSKGDQSALDELTPAVYHELRNRARNYLRRERAGHTLQATALIHEVYLRLVTQSRPEWRGRAHFFAVASQIMRQILVDHARRKKAAKRGSGGQAITLDEALLVSNDQPVDLIAMDRAMEELAAFDSRKCKIVEMRYFGGCTVEETAEVLGIAPITVHRESRVAEAWLRRAMGAAATANEGG